MSIGWGLFLLLAVFLTACALAGWWSGRIKH
jgi:hypothetical protein